MAAAGEAAGKHLNYFLVDIRAISDRRFRDR